MSGVLGELGDRAVKPGDIIIKPFDEVWRLMRLDQFGDVSDADLRLSRDLQTIAMLAMHKVGDTPGRRSGSQASTSPKGYRLVRDEGHVRRRPAHEALAQRVGLNN